MRIQAYLLTQPASHKDELENHRMLEVIPPLRSSEVFQAYRHTAETGVPTILEAIDFRDAGRPWVAGTYDIRAVKMGDRLAITLTECHGPQADRGGPQNLQKNASPPCSAPVPMAMTVSTFDEGRFIEANDSFLHMTGYTREEVIGLTTLELELWESGDDRRKMLSELARTGELSQFASESSDQVRGDTSVVRRLTRPLVCEEKRLC
jgi:PAS domain S-box-containing protein